MASQNPSLSPSGQPGGTREKALGRESRAAARSQEASEAVAAGVAQNMEGMGRRRRRKESPRDQLRPAWRVDVSLSSLRAQTQRRGEP